MGCDDYYCFLSYVVMGVMVMIDTADVMMVTTALLMCCWGYDDDYSLNMLW